MADLQEPQIYKKLKKIFTSDVVVRNIGGKQLKVIDVDQIQKFGTSTQNDRFTRMYSTLNYRLSSQQAMYGMESQRLRLFRDYEVMDTDAIIASALDIYSEETTMKNEMGDMLRIKAGNHKVREVLENLYYEILNLEFTLPTWVRGMCKYGDYFLKLELAEKYGVTNVIPLPVYELRRIEGEDPTKPNVVKFYLQGGSTKQGAFDNFEIAHFRLVTDSNFLPYGKSMVEPARRVWKQLILMEDAMLIHRIMRAPERRIFKIDVGNIAPNEIDAYMKRFIAQAQKVPYIDPETGEYNLKFNLQNSTEDFYFPVRGGDGGTSVENLQGLEYNAIDDIEYLRNKEMAALKIPKAFLGYDEQVGSKATLASEDVRFARTIEKIQKIIVSELYKIGLIHLLIQGFDGNDLIDWDINLTTPSIIYEQEKIELWSSKMNLARDMKDGKMISQNWIYKNIFNMTDDEIIDEEQKVVEDQIRNYRLEQIEQDGNDPAISQQSVDGEGEVNDNNLNYEKVDPSQDGRSGVKSRTRTKDEPFGEDPIGQKDYNNILKLDADLHSAYDGNKKKHLSRKVAHAENILGTKIKRKRILSENDLGKLKNYFKFKKKDKNKDESNNININEESKDDKSDK